MRGGDHGGGEVTEDEAKGKWCPFSHGERDQFSRTQATPINGRPYWDNCIGSACMAWREMAPQRFINGKLLRMDELGYPDEAVVKVLMGRCGLAGKP